MQKNGWNLFTAFGVLSGVLLTGCGGKGSGSNSLYKTSVTRMTELEKGIILYIGDYDDRITPGASWIESTKPYVKDPNAYNSPAVTTTSYGYALNSDIAGHAYTEVANPDQTICFFDSTILTQDASEPTTTLPSPPRYGTKNTIGYLDGRTQDENIVPTPPLQPGQVSLSRVKQLELGISLYTNDWDDHFPQAQAWMDDLTPYVKNAELFHSPAIEDQNPSLYGYAFNAGATSHSLADIASPSTTFGVFDSTDLVRNATDLPSTAPSPGRYSGKNAIGFLDGHAALK